MRPRRPPVRRREHRGAPQAAHRHPAARPPAQSRKPRTPDQYGQLLGVAGGALYDSHEWPNRFTILDISDDTRVLRATTFIWDDGRWIRDRNLYQTEDGVGEFRLKKKASTSTTSISPLWERLAGAISDGQLATDEDGSGVPKISPSIPRFQQTPNGQDLAIRQRQLEEAIPRLHADRKLVIHKEPGRSTRGSSPASLGNSGVKGTAASRMRCTSGAPGFRPISSFRTRSS